MRESRHASRGERMASNAEPISEKARRLGLTEHEARILDHLDQATDLYWQMREENRRDWSLDTEAWMGHYSNLVRLLMLRVVKRDYPDGWLSEGERQEREEREQTEADES
jgi:hypothetical protein